MSEYIPESFDVTDEMIDAGVDAIQRRGIGIDESIPVLRDALRVVFLEMVGAFHLSRKSGAK